MSGRINLEEHMYTNDNATRNNQELHNRLTDISVQAHTHRSETTFCKTNSPLSK